MKDEEVDKWGYPKNREHDFSNPEGNFATGIALGLAAIFIITVIIFHIRTVSYTHLRAHET